MADASARAHALPVARADHRSGAEAILVLQRSLENIGDDFHVAMGMRGKTVARQHPVFIDDPQGPESHVLRVVIIREESCVLY